MTLPADSHTHSEWSWDARNGSMAGSCARAVELGLPAIAFTEHLDHTVWTVALDALQEGDFLAELATPDGRLIPPRFDAAGYLAAIDECRERFPGLRILSGLELGEPHWHAEEVAKVLGTGEFDLLLGSLHSLPDEGGFAEPPGLFGHRAAAEVVREYLAEIARLVSESDVFAVLAHIDYPLRYWPAAAGPFEFSHFEDEFRYALELLADGGRTLEVNTATPMDAQLVRWWRDEGGRKITLGSDGHEPAQIGRRFAETTAMVEAHGFRPGRHPHDFWTHPG